MKKHILGNPAVKFLAVFLAYSLFFPMHIFALPQDGQVVAGQATVTQTDALNMSIQQNSSKAIINWRDFSISAQEAVRFLQPGASAVALNRVVGTDPSLIYGLLSANGRIFVINPNGVLVGASGKIDVNSFVASTLDIGNQDFMAGNFVFSRSLGEQLAAISNRGSIAAADGGFVALLGAGVENQGSIVANLGKIYIGTGEQATLTFAGNDLISFALDGDIQDQVTAADGRILTSGIENTGQIRAAGGQVVLNASLARNVVQSVVNTDGIIEATSLDGPGGSIQIAGSSQGEVINAGTLDASGSSGGEIVVEGSRVIQDSEIRADGIGGAGGSIAVWADDTLSLGSASVTSASAGLIGDGGNVGLFGQTRLDISDGALIAVTGGQMGGSGGFVETSGDELAIGYITIDISASAGPGGTWLIDPNILDINAALASTIVNDLDIDGATVIAQAETTINLNAAIDSHTQTSTSTLRFQDENVAPLEINLYQPVTLGAGQTLTGDGTTIAVGVNGLIQNGIDVAADGARINVAAGTYTEDLVITKTDLELAGADDGNPGLTTIQGVAMTDSTLWPLAAPNIEVIANGVHIHGFAIEGPAPASGFYASGMVIGGDNVEIDHNTFQVPNSPNHDDISQGLQTYTTANNPVVGADLSGLAIHDNTFGAFGAGAAGYEAIYINPTDTSVGPVTIANNTFGGALVRGITTERSNVIVAGNTIQTSLMPMGGSFDVGDSLQGINAVGALDAITIANNTISGVAVGNGFSQGIRLGSAGHVLSNIGVRNNFIEDGDSGVLVRGDGSVTFFENALSDNTVAVENTGTGAVDASGNWFGTVDPAAVVSGGVDYTPWLAGGTDVDVGTAGFQGDFSELYVGAGGVQTGTTGRIQEAIDMVAAAATVNVAAGTYTEDLVITKTDLELAGADDGNPGLTTIQGVAMTDSTLWPLAAPNIEVIANGVHIHGFAIEGPAPASGFYASGMVIGGDNVEIDHNTFQVPNSPNHDDISQGLQTYTTANNPVVGADLSGLAIHDNTFGAFGAGAAGYEAIYINPTDTSVGPVTIANNTFGGALVRGITTERSNVIVAGNTIQTSLMPMGGSFDVGDSLQGINAVGALDAITIANNTISGVAVGNGFSQGIRLGSAGHVLSNIGVRNNFIEDGDSGVLVRGDGSVTFFENALSDNTVAVENTGTGAVDASGNWFGTVDPAAVVSGGVDYTPWLAGGTDVDVGTAGFQGDFSELYVGAGGVQTGGMDYIGEGISMATAGAGSVVNVVAGDYAEDVNIGKDVDLYFRGIASIDGITTTNQDATIKNDGKLTIDGSVNLKSNIDLGADLTISANAALIRLDGTVNGDYNVELNTTGSTTINGVIGGGEPVASLTTNAGGTTNLGANVSAQGSTITFNDAVVLTTDLILKDTGVTGVTFGSTLDGSAAGAQSLSIVGNGVFDGAVGGTALEFLTVSGTSAINGVSVETSDADGGTGIQTYSGAATLGADTTLTGATVTFGDTLDGTTAGAQSLAIVGNGVFDGIVGGTALEFLTVSGTSAINGGSVDTSGGTDYQTYSGAATLGADTTLTGATVTFGDTLDGTTAGAQSLSIVGNGVFDGAVGGTALEFLTVSGTSAINGGSVDTSDADGGTGIQTYSGAATLGADTTLTGATVTFGDTLDGTTAGAQSLAIVGNGVFDGAVGGTALEFLTVSGTSAINGGSVDTSDADGGTGIQTYSGAATLGADTTLTGATVTFGDTLDGTTAGAQSLAIVGNGVFDGIVGGTALEFLTVSGTSAINGGSVDTSDADGGTGIQTYSGAATLGADTTLTGATVTFGDTLDGTTAGAQSLAIVGNGVFDGAVGGTALEFLTVSGTSAINGGSVDTSDADGGTGIQTYSGAATLGADTTLTGATVTFGDTLDGTTAGAQSLSIVGNGVFDGIVGGTALEFLTVSGTSAINGGSVDTSGGTDYQTYSGAATLGADTTLTGATVTFGDTLDGTTAGAQSLTIVGNGVFDGIVGGTALEFLTVSGTSAINGGSVDTSGGTDYQTYSGAATLGADTTLTGTTVTFGDTLDGTTAGAQSLAIVGNGVFDGIVGGTALEFLTVSGTSAINGDGVTTAGLQTYTGAVTLDAAGNATTLDGTGVTFQSTVQSATDGEDGLTVTDVGTTRFNGVVGGGGQRLASVTTNGGGITQINGGAVTTGGAQQYDNAVVLGIDTALEGTTVTFGSTLDGTTAGVESLGITGNGVFNGIVGGTALEFLTVSGTSAINGNGVITASLQTYTGAVTLDAASNTTTLDGTGVTFQSTVQSATDGEDGLTVTDDGTTRFNGVVGGGGQRLASVTTNGGGITQINGGGVTTTEDQLYSDAVLIGADAVLTGNDVTFTGTLDSQGGAARALTLNTVNAGVTTFTGAVGGISPLASLTTNADGSVWVHADVTTSGSTMTFNDKVILKGDVLFTDTGGTGIAFNGAVNGPAFTFTAEALDGKVSFTTIDASAITITARNTIDVESMDTDPSLSSADNDIVLTSTDGSILFTAPADNQQLIDAGTGKIVLTATGGSIDGTGTLVAKSASFIASLLGTDGRSMVANVDQIDEIRLTGIENDFVSGYLKAGTQLLGNPNPVTTIDAPGLVIIDPNFTYGLEGFLGRLFSLPTASVDQERIEKILAQIRNASFFMPISLIIENLIEEPMFDDSQASIIMDPWNQWVDGLWTVDSLN